MGIIIATLLVLLVIVSALAQDFSVFSWAYWQEGGSGTSRSEVFRNFGLFFVAVVALGFGIWRAVTGYMQAQASQRQAEAANEQAEAANEQARIAQQGQFTERFSRAAEHLGSGQLPLRLGGIYALWRLAQDSPEHDVISVIDILCAFVRDPPPGAARQPGLPPPRTPTSRAPTSRTPTSRTPTSRSPTLRTPSSLRSNWTPRASVRTASRRKKSAGRKYRDAAMMSTHRGDPRSRAIFGFSARF